MSGVPISPYLFLAVVGVICAGVFFNGLRFSRMTKNPWASKALFGQPIEGHDLSVERIRLIGKVQMAVAPLLFLLMSYLVLSGEIGPLYGPDWLS